ncbi:hypothetical protein O6P43_007871 [Quillaja saponaria]|uniref:Uncharacterized protein n=1 Tax=Quillaja saponaria TaxID=32244 RepID=A0AAD7M3Z3_QUISA|nr:hypothetical protein O6P43_007871 [Quillaja saponaria]
MRVGSDSIHLVKANSLFSCRFQISMQFYSIDSCISGRSKKLKEMALLSSAQTRFAISATTGFHLTFHPVDWRKGQRVGSNR